MTTKPTPTTNVIDFAAAKAENRLKHDDLSPALHELADRASKGEVRNIFLAWTMADGSLHYGHASLTTAAEHWDDDQLRLLGLLRLAERGFLDGLSLD